MIEEELFIGSVFISDVVSFDLSDQAKTEICLERLGQGYREH